MSMDELFGSDEPDTPMGPVGHAWKREAERLRAEVVRLRADVERLRAVLGGAPLCAGSDAPADHAWQPLKHLGHWLCARCGAQAMSWGIGHIEVRQHTGRMSLTPACARYACREVGDTQAAEDYGTGIVRMVLEEVRRVMPRCTAEDALPREDGLK